MLREELAKLGEGERRLKGGNPSQLRLGSELPSLRISPSRGERSNDPMAASGRFPPVIADNCLTTVWPRPTPPQPDHQDEGPEYRVEDIKGAVGHPPCTVRDAVSRFFCKRRRENE